METPGVQNDILEMLQGRIEDPTGKRDEKTAEEELAESIRRLAEASGKPV